METNYNFVKLSFAVIGGLRPGDTKEQSHQLGKYWNWELFLERASTVFLWLANWFSVETLHLSLICIPKIIGNNPSFQAIVHSRKALTLWLSTHC